MFIYAFIVYIDSALLSGKPAGITCTSVYWFVLLNWKLRMVIQLLTAYCATS